MAPKIQMSALNTIGRKQFGRPRIGSALDIKDHKGSTSLVDSVRSNHFMASTSSHASAIGHSAYKPKPFLKLKPLDPLDKPEPF